MTAERAGGQPGGLAALPPVVPVSGALRRYAWGSHTALQRLLDEPVDGRPAAELWFGAHADDPSPALATTLDRVIAADPEAVLGAATLARHGPQLPYLLKVLAAGAALSIQVHPSREQAERGFDREQAAGVPADAPHRTYRDRNAKPELICALTRFEALCGFRPVPELVALLDELDEPELAPAREALAGPDPLRSAFTAVLRHPRPRELAHAVAARAERAGGADGSLRPVALAAADFPGDVGVALALLLTPVVLEPGEALFLGAGTVHAYLRGTGVEIMGNSDNVLRCGLTPKHVDVAELLAITDFTAVTDPRWAAEVSAGSWDYAPPVDAFALTRLELDPAAGAVALGDPGPHLVLCTEGAAEVSVGGASVPLRAGRAAFVPARPEAYVVRGAGQVFVARPGAATR